VILIGLTSLVFMLQACKVIVEDTNGNRLGDLDSINWDSLLASSSSFSWPTLSYTWSSGGKYSSISYPPYSSFNPYSSSSHASSGSSSGVLSSGTSSGTSSSGISSSRSSSSRSSSSVYPSSSSAACMFATVKTYPARTIYSWIALYASGVRDTVFNYDSTTYMGAKPTFLSPMTITLPIGTIAYSTSTQYICPSSPLYSYIDSTGSVTVQNPPKDTVAFNYGAKQRDPLVAPKVAFPNKDSVIALFDTIQSFNEFHAIHLGTSHFNGDQARISLQAPTWIALDNFAPDSLTVQTGSCPGVKARVAFPYTATGYDYYLVMNPSASVQANATQHWVLRIRNKYGYSDAITLDTYVNQGVCPTTP